MKPQAELRIELAKRNGDSVLDLSSLGLTQVPESLCDLFALTALTLDGNELTTLPPSLGNLTALTTLHLGRNQITSLPESLGNLVALKWLNLGRNHLTAVPESLGNLAALTTLNLFGNQLVTAPESLGNLTALTWLNLGENILTAIPDSLGDLARLKDLNLFANQLTTVPERLSKLAALTTLNLDHNQLTALPDSIGHLAALTTLNLGHNQLTALPDSIGHLAALTTLNLDHNQLTALPDSIGHLAALSTLNLRHNQLTALPAPLGSLSQLTSLDVGGNQLTSVPESVGNLTALTRLSLEGNPVVTPPSEIVAAGVRQVLVFLRGLQAGAIEQWSSKMLVVGEGAVGKTSLTKALCDLPYDRDEPQTHGVHVDPLVLPHPNLADTQMRLNVWDFGGQLEYRATQRFYLTDRSLFVLVWYSRHGWRMRGQVEAWLEAITIAAPKSPILVVATHAHESTVDLDEADIRRRYPLVTGFLRVDCADGHGVDKLRQAITIASGALPLMGQRWPTTWVRAANSLGQQDVPYAGAVRVDSLLHEAGVADPLSRQTLMTALHDRGDVLHFARDPELRDLIVLAPTWVDGLITRILDSQEVADRGGLLGRAHRDAIWHDLEPGMAEKLTTMMERFDLAYRIDSPDHDDVALVVERLPAGAPAYLPDEWVLAMDDPRTTQLRVDYKLASRQAGIPSWFIAREHRYTTGIKWARGVLLRHRGASSPAMALLEDDDSSQPTIRLTVRGAAPHTFYSILDEAFMGILADRYPGLAVRRFIPCPCAPPPLPACDKQFDYDDAVDAFDAGEQIQCNRSRKMVDPRSLLLGLRPTTLDQVVSLVGQVINGQAKIEETQLVVLDTVRDLLRYRGEQGVRCPSVFTITKVGGTRYELELYCEQPDAPHPLPDGAGVYQLTHLPAWLRRYAPYLRKILTVIRFAAPLVVPALTGLGGVQLPEPDKARLDGSRILLDDLLALPKDSAGRLLARTSSPRSPVDFAELRAAISAIDPDWGGLRERELPESHEVAYLCVHHRDALRYPARIRDQDESA